MELSVMALHCTNRGFHVCLFYSKEEKKIDGQQEVRNILKFPRTEAWKL
jgi:hypothetical protein